MTLSEQFFAKIAGWEAMKHGRALLVGDKVLSSNWSPPILKGVVQEGAASYRAGLAIKSETDIENLCTCRVSREWGTICAHSVAVGLHHLRGDQTPKPSAAPAPKPAMSALQRSTTEGEEAELYCILPPALDQALARDKVMVCFEARWKSQRRPLNALPKDQSFKFSEQDTLILDRVESLAAGQAPAMLMLGADDFASLLNLLIGHPRVTMGKTVAVEVSAEPLPLPLRAELMATGEVQLSSGGNVSGTVVGGGWVWQSPAFRPLGLPQRYVGLLDGPIRIPRAEVPIFIGRDWPQLQIAGAVASNFSVGDFAIETEPPRILLDLRGGLAQLDARLHFRYGQRVLTAGVGTADVWMPDPDAPRRYIARDVNAERAALSRLQRAGFIGPDAQGNLRLSGNDRVLGFFAGEYARLQREWEVTMEERLQRSTSEKLERIEPRFEVTSSGVQWFDLNISYATAGGERFSAADIQRLILSGQGHTRLRNGKTAILDTGAVEELQEVLLDSAPQQGAQGYRLNQAQAGFINATLAQQGWRAQAPADWRARAAQQSGDARLECPPLGALENVLRPYQKEGVAWLHFLRANGFAGILADEMGLGKTLQALAFLQSLGPGRRTALIVCPTSLVWNWLSEAQKFTPNLRVLALHGPARESWFSRLEEFDIVVTSYALIRRDAEKYTGIEFDTLILDEAQHIKNRQTQNAQAVKAIRSRHRIVLTGTPLENSVLDLWSIFDFLMPGYLGAAQDFRERYEIPITREKNDAALGRLSRRLRPFMLRRLKRDVAKDLPARLDQVSFCELTSDQQAVYQELLNAGRRQIIEAVGAQGLARSRVLVLNTLLRLRQACCDLRLLKLDNVEPANASAKLDLFGELLEEVIDGGHRVLVFSQFVSMLQLLRDKLSGDQIEHCYLDGATMNRGEVVQRFQTTNTPVFLISLKAGGVGLNLTGADTVIHFDPWWNPAVEDQATDRAHRIGQTRVVTSYKLIARGTVEEKILALQTRKREVIQAALAGEEALSQSLTWEEIQELLAS